MRNSEISPINAVFHAHHLENGNLLLMLPDCQWTRDIIHFFDHKINLNYFLPTLSIFNFKFKINLAVAFYFKGNPQYSISLGKLVVPFKNSEKYRWGP